MLTISAPFQPAVAKALALGDGFYDQLRGDYLRRRNFLCRGLEDAGFEDLDQFTVTRQGDLPNSNYTNWQLDQLGDLRSNRLPSEDANHDGIANLLHYAFGTLPTEIDFVANSVRVALTSEGFAVSYHRNKNANGVSIVLESYNSGSGEWETLSSESETVEATAEDHIEKVTLNYSLAIDSQFMLRLKTNS